jgi:rhodanese-related sulfurtransferase
MTNNARSNVEIAVNVIIAVAVVVVAGITVKRYFFESPAASKRQSQHIVVGARMNVPGVNWEENKKTLAFFLKKDCTYCESSAPFYRLLIEEASKRGVKLLAVLPNSVEEGRDYVKSLGLPIQDIYSGALESFKIQGTPTVTLLDNTGTVISVLVGGVTAAREQEMREELIPLFDAEIVRRVSSKKYPQGLTGAAGEGGPIDIDAAELKKLIDAKEQVTVIDVDEREDYRKEHIPGAKNFPSDELFARAEREIPKSERVVVYCRCEGYGSSAAARSELLNQGYAQVLILKEGIAGWKKMGMPTAASN